MLQKTDSYVAVGFFMAVKNATVYLMINPLITSWPRKLFLVAYT
jgi:hypothetical protein